jgi:hypothetical protein
LSLQHFLQIGPYWRRKGKFNIEKKPIDPNCIQNSRDGAWTPGAWQWAIFINHSWQQFEYFAFEFRWTVSIQARIWIIQVVRHLCGKIKKYNEGYAYFIEDPCTVSFGLLVASVQVCIFTLHLLKNAAIQIFSGLWMHFVISFLYGIIAHWPFVSLSCVSMVLELKDGG